MRILSHSGGFLTYLLIILKLLIILHIIKFEEFWKKNIYCETKIVCSMLVSKWTKYLSDEGALTLSWRRSLSYLYDIDLRHERINDSKHVWKCSKNIFCKILLRIFRQILKRRNTWHLIQCSIYLLKIDSGNDTIYFDITRIETY